MDSENKLQTLSPTIDLDFSLPPETPSGPDPRDRKTYYTRVTPARRVAQPVILAVIRLLAITQARGTENLPGRGPVILASNHLTNFDVLVLQRILARPIFFMGKAEIYRQPVMDWWLRQLGSFPVERGAHDVWALQQAERVLCAGQVLGMFPEGKRNQGSGLRPAKTGVARLALKLDCPILPVGLQGTQYMLRRFPRRTPVSVTFGELIYPQEGDTPLSLTDRMMFKIAALLPPEQRGVYVFQPGGA